MNHLFSFCYLSSWCKKYMNSFPFPFCMEHKGHKNVREINFTRKLLTTYPSKWKGKVISCSQRHSRNWRWVSKLKVTDHPKQPASCTITTCNLVELRCVKKTKMAKEKRQPSLYNIIWILKVLTLTISLSVLQIWTARMSPPILCLSMLAYKRCNTLSGSSSERSKT